MSESTQGKEVDKTPEKSILPVSKESVDNALEEIIQDPTRTMSREQALMKKQNPVLFDNLDDFAKKLGSAGYFDLMEGACWTYKILRIQADTCGRELPQISPDLLLTYIHDNIQYANEQSEKKEFVPFEERVKKIATQDPEFGRAIKEFTKYRVIASGFYSGAIEVYDLIKNALQSEELARKFNLEPTPEKSIEQFLEELPAERKLLSEEERKEAMVVAREVWKKAMEKTKGQSSISLKAEIAGGEQSIVLFTGEKVETFHPENPRTDLVINVNPPMDKDGNAISSIVHQYRFAPDEVVKRTVDMSAQRSINVNQFLEIKNPVERTNIIERARAQQMEEVYHPDKADLSGLLAAISSVK